MNTAMGSSLGSLYLTLVCFILFRQPFWGAGRGAAHWWQEASCAEVVAEPAGGDPAG